jgi:hypothetical protein
VASNVIEQQAELFEKIVGKVLSIGTATFSSQIPFK